MSEDREDRRRRLFARLYSSFDVRPIDQAAEAAWRLGGQSPWINARLFQYPIGGQYPSDMSRVAEEADTNMQGWQFDNFDEFVLESWMLRLSKGVDDQLRAFFGACSVRLEIQGPQVITPLIDLLERVPLVGTDERGTRVIRKHDNLRAEIRVSPEAHLVYSRHLAQQDPPLLKVWLYLEGTAVTGLR